jgi:hypothetical protein
MDKRYQVFVSSTYEDLIEERAYVISMLMKGRHIPASMESFTAGGQPPWAKITKSIDESDYYVLIIAGRYGSIDPEEGISYTEKEYNYALKKGIPILAFIHRNPGRLDADKTDFEYDEELKSFIKKVEDSSIRTIDHWDNLHQLGGLVSTALNSEISENPGVGWVRADSNIPKITHSQEKENTPLKKDPFVKTITINQMEKTCLDVLMANDHNENINVFHLLGNLADQGIENKDANRILKTFEYKRGFVKSYTNDDDYGTPYLKYRITKLGWDWISSHNEIFDEEVPF